MYSDRFRMEPLREELHGTMSTNCSCLGKKKLIDKFRLDNKFLNLKSFLKGSLIGKFFIVFMLKKQNFENILKTRSLSLTISRC